MAFTKYQCFLAILLVTTGTINTLTTKWADKLDAKGSDGEVRKFNHPFVQALAMFLGEILCLLVFKSLFCHYKKKEDGSEDTQNLVKGNRNFNQFLLYIPAICDMTATSTMYIGLSLTFASSFQMLRGSVIIFVALLSVAFLQRKIVCREWIGIFFIIAGLGIVGVSDVMSSNDEHDTNSIITGDLLIVAAQIITAAQMVIEEKFISGQDIPPLQAVGWEGVFGFATLALLMIPFNFIPVGSFGKNSRGVLEDLPDAFVQMYNNPLLFVAILGTICSIAFFNFAGISVTKEISATTRMVLDSLRTFLIWMFSLSVRWQDFHWVQLIGFVSLLFGMCLYNNLIPFRNIRFRRNRPDGTDEETAVISEPADAHR